jgi:hypothetical protein
MRKFVLFSLTCVTLFMLALGTHAADIAAFSVDKVEVANVAPPPDPWPVA